jgi:hypothetical protein
MAVVTGLIGVIVGAFLAAWLARAQRVREARTQHTLALVEEFHSPRMLEARHLAKSTLVYHEGPPISVAEHRSRGGQEWIAISSVLHYLDKVEVLLDARLADRDLIDRLLGRYIRVWLEYVGPDHLLLDAYQGPGHHNGQVTEWHPLKESLRQLARRFPGGELLEPEGEVLEPEGE